MAKDRFAKLLTGLDPNLQKLLSDVLRFEQENISYERIPNRREEVDRIVSQAAERQLKNR